jgi:hypothetical protein
MLPGHCCDLADSIPCAWRRDFVLSYAQLSLLNYAALLQPVSAKRGYFGSWGYTNVDSVQSTGVSFRCIVHSADAGQVNIEICALSSLALSSRPLLIDLS